MILVVGATGALGSEICRLLTTRNRSVRALVRPTADHSRVEQLRTLGVALVQGDLKDRASLDEACRGAEAVISTATTTTSRQPGDSIPSVDQDGQLELVEAARAAGVRRFVYVSYSGHFDLECPLTTAKRKVEQSLAQSGMTYTVLRPSFFMEMWLSPALGFDPQNARAQLFGSGEAKISFVSAKDVARFAVDCLDNPAAHNATIELGGPEALSPREVVRRFEQAGGRAFTVDTVPEAALEAQLAGATDPLQQSFTALMIGYARGDAIDMTDTLTRFGEHLTSVDEFARQTTDAPA
ncbi:MAG TPA: SDR family oxidoreductase [Gemmatimonadaceae bacterium]|jgi:NADH dehydrogenase